jgi:hypothetical protein
LLSLKNSPLRYVQKHKKIGKMTYFLSIETAFFLWKLPYFLCPF